MWESCVNKVECCWTALMNFKLVLCSAMFVNRIFYNFVRNFVELSWIIFGHPQRGLNLWFSLRPYVFPSVHSVEISKSVPRNFLIFGTKLGLPNATEVTFLDFAQKIPLWLFWSNLIVKSTFQPISKSCAKDFLSFVYLNCISGLYMKNTCNTWEKPCFGCFGPFR